MRCDRCPSWPGWPKRPKRSAAAAILVADEGTDRDLYVTLAALAQRTQQVLLSAR